MQMPEAQRRNGNTFPFQIKEQLRPLSDRVTALVGDCQAMIKSAPPEVNTKVW